MDKFAAIFCIPAAGVKEWMENVDEATRKEQSDKLMADWKAWSETHKDAIVGEGMPLGKTKRVTNDGVEDVVNDLNYLMVVQAESHAAAAELLQGNPHVQQIPGSYVEVMTTSGPANS